MKAAARLRNLVPVGAAAEGDGSSSSGGTGSTAAAEFEELSLGNGYRLPVQEIRDIVDAPPLPNLTLPPRKDKILFLKRNSLPNLADLARPEEKLAGLRIDGKSYCRSRMSSYTGISVYQILEDYTLGPEREISGLPSGAKINFVTWSNDGSYLAFAIRTNEDDGSSSMLRLWVADMDAGNARPLFKAADICLNAVFDK
ncbi:hypothetical protein M569_14885 [Genlisea aurea]|uniref:Uncharacterized protein n=1 Tax=Genlisea aurea TaxID=192259 RepID=S8BZV2_9LAMI|nr:hypothetical protein M569_14885 [Genlisea aurea]